MTTGPHPMYFRRQQLNKERYLTAIELRSRRNGEYVRTAGLAIVKQRPGTAKGFVFMSVSEIAPRFSAEKMKANQNLVEVAAPYS